MKRMGAVLLFLVSFSSVVFSQEWAVSTNLAGYLNLGTINAEVTYAPLRHVSFSVSGRYNPFTYHGNDGNQFQERQRTFSAGSRWWPWHVMTGWWVAAKLQYQEYNVGGILSRRTEEGDKAGFVLGAGYTLMLHKHLNIEFGVGAWAGYKWYTVYSCPTCGMTMEHGSKAFALPDDLLVSIAYVF